MEKILTDANFQEEVLKSNVPVFVDFWAPWCGPCRMTSPFVEQLAHEMEGKNIKVGKLNVDESPNTAGTYNVLSIPTFMIFKGGQQVDQIVGGVQMEKLKELMEKYI